MSLRAKMRKAAADATYVADETSVLIGVDAAYEFMEPLTATARLLEKGIDLERVSQILASRENWDQLVNAYEVLAVLEAVKKEMEEMA